MSDTSSALPESPESVSSHNALSTGQQTVINKLFRRLIVFLFVLFIFSFLDRINIGFAGLTMGQDLGLSATMFGLATTLFYATYVIFGIPSNVMLSIVGARHWIATIMVLWGIASTATMFAVGPKSLYVLRMLVGITEAGFLPGILLYLTYWFPAFFRARANAFIYDCHAGHYRVGVDCLRLYFIAGRHIQSAWMAVVIPVGRISVSFVRHYGLVLPG
ncbi:4-hydroxyphenylacetate permease [Salmonella enterica subsp. enterica serovar Typhimurium]|nr:4-hydroxyphenylacetate permease [Salmonella enterica subsp. enterica serovar Typhimurium]